MSGISNNRNGKPQRRVRKDGWTKDRRKGFLKVLADTCNVTRAVEAVGMSVGGAYQLRARDREFARLWAETLDGGYQRLEDELVARALGQASDARNPEEAPTPSDEPSGLDPELALAMLKLRGARPQESRRRAAPAPPQDEVDAELMRRLGDLAERLAAQP